MNKINNIRRFLKDTAGATMIEYAILAALVSVVAIAAITTVGSSVNTTFGTVGTKLQGASR